jgi:hypothetical protein
MSKDKLPAWLGSAKVKTTRYRSGKQETRLAKELKGTVTINSGATFGQNDVITDFCEVEAKTTLKDSFRFTYDDWLKLNKKIKFGKIPIYIVEFEAKKESLCVIKYDDLKYLIESANADKT